jgi:uncharacterized protein
MPSGSRRFSSASKPSSDPFVIVDIHIHYTPPELARRLPELAEYEPYWAALLAPGPSGLSLQGWADAGRMLADMERAGIDQVVLQGEYYQQHAACAARNDESIELVRRHGGRVRAFAVVQPLAGAHAIAEVERCTAAGLEGVGELKPYAQGFALDGPDFLRLAEACLRHDLPLLLHANEPVGPFYPGKATTPLAAYYGLAVRYPELRLVLAHWGGGLVFYEMIPAVRRALANVWYDTAASPLTYPTETIVPVALACVAPHKILFGSDYPLRLFPREQAEPDFRPFLRRLDALPLDPETRAAIMGRNAANLLAKRAPSQAGPRAAPPAAIPLTPHSSVALLAAAYPATRQVFERHGIAWQDTAVPFWEPVDQAARARGYNSAALGHLLEELREAISGGGVPGEDIVLP